MPKKFEMDGQKGEIDYGTLICDFHIFPKISLGRGECAQPQQQGQSMFNAYAYSASLLCWPNGHHPFP
jgi:hypothetical protein